jgi:demethylspheroidene O-methyltransferase
MIYASGQRVPFALDTARPRPPSSWQDRYSDWRNRLISDPRFQRWAARFPLTRRIAQKRAQTLFDMCAGFVYSQVLAACVRLKLFDLLSERPQTIAELSSKLSLKPETMSRLANAALALRLVERRSHNRFGLGVHGAAFVGNPAISVMVEHHALLYSDLSDPVSLLRHPENATALSGYWPYARTGRPTALTADDVAQYSALMSASQTLIAEEVMEAWPFASHRCLLDVGGGEGAFLMAAAARAKNLRLMLYDLPAVAELARIRLGAAGLMDRISICSGDFFTQPLPRGADIVTLVRVLHDHDDRAAFSLLSNIRRTLPDDGVLLIVEPMSESADGNVIADAYFGFYLLAMGSGRARSPGELGHLLQAAGFDRGRLLKTPRPMLTRAVIARPSAKSL